MDADTPATQSFKSPATQSFPSGNPIENNPIENNPIQDKVSTPARPTGPNAAPIVLGLIALAVAGLIIVNETMRLRVDWSQVGPGAVVGIGLLLVALGAVGLVRRHDDA